MLSGAHVMIFSRDAEADRAFFRDILQLPTIDGGGGWLISGLPPAEVGFHPAGAGEPTPTDLFFMCEDINALVAALHEKHVEAGPVTDEGWGLATRIKLPSGAQLGVYQPRHAHPPH